jgi:hypothetical protein
LLIGGLTLGLGTWACLGRSSRVLFQKVHLQGEIKKGRNGQHRIYSRKSAEEVKGKAGMGSYLCMGPFILALDSFYGLTGNSIICFEAISYSFPSFGCFSYLWTSIYTRFLGLYQGPPVPRVFIVSPRAVTLLSPFTS